MLLREKEGDKMDNFFSGVKKVTIILVVVTVLLGGGIWLFGAEKKSPSNPRKVPHDSLQLEKIQMLEEIAPPSLQDDPVVKEQPVPPPVQPEPPKPPQIKEKPKQENRPESPPPPKSPASTGVMLSKGKSGVTSRALTLMAGTKIYYRVSASSNSNHPINFRVTGPGGASAVHNVIAEQSEQYVWTIPKTGNYVLELECGYRKKSDCQGSGTFGH